MMYDCEPAKVYHEKERVARKRHCCCECGIPIEVGERYLDVWGIWDGPGRFRQHLLCRDACVAIRQLENGECIPFGCLTEWYNEYHHELKQFRQDPKAQRVRTLIGQVKRRMRRWRRSTSE